MISPAELANELGHGREKQTGQGRWMTLCPAHYDHNPSLSIDTAPDGKILLKCHSQQCANSDIIAELQERGLWPKPNGDQNGANRGERRRQARTERKLGAPVAISDYICPDGQLGYQTLKYETLDDKGERKKTFLQRRPCPTCKGEDRGGCGDKKCKRGWIWNLKGTPRLLYRLLAIIESASQPRPNGELRGIAVVEGEKCADAVTRIGLNGTTNSEGATKWHPEFNPYFRDRYVVIFEDRDSKGERHTLIVARNLKGFARSIKIVRAKDLGLTEPKSDVADWVERREREGKPPEEIKAELLAIIEQIPEWQDEERVGIEIDADSDDLVTTTGLAWRALIAKNSPPRLFLRGDLPVRAEHDDRGAVVTRPLTRERMTHELVRAANWTKQGKGAEKGLIVCGRPHRHHIEDFMATPSPPLPTLQRITSVPIFAADGKLIIEPGYHAGILYSPPPGFFLPTVQDSPGEDDLRKAMGLIDELLFDFPFVEPSDRAHAVGLLLLPFARELIAGPTPLHRIEGPIEGAGKGLLADVLMAPGLHGHVASIAEPTSDEEWRKQITTYLIAGYGALKIDNVEHPLTAGAFAKALTDYFWTDRILGVNKDVNLPMRWLWIMTANNPVLSGELRRRSIRTRIDPRCEHPELRTGFRHDLPKWAIENRAGLIWSALTLIRHWVSRERPAPAPSVKPLGSYEDWTRVVGGILHVASIPGFLESVTTDATVVSGESGAMSEFVTKWRSQFGDRTVQCSDLIEIAKQIDGVPLAAVIQRGRNEQRWGRRSVSIVTAPWRASGSPLSTRSSAPRDGSCCRSSRRRRRRRRPKLRTAVRSPAVPSWSCQMVMLIVKLNRNFSRRN